MVGIGNIVTLKANKKGERRGGRKPGTPNTNTARTKTFSCGATTSIMVVDAMSARYAPAGRSQGHGAKPASARSCKRARDRGQSFGNK
jgi:hypothetical protein